MSGALRDELCKRALDAAARGFPVFPLRPGTKIPAVAKWQEHATTDPETIRKVWARGEYNIGIKTGHGLVVVDIDIKNEKPGAASFTALGLSAAEKDTFRVKTASGGWHVYFHGDADCSVDRLGPGLDVRGRGGYVVGAGSVLANGSGQGAYAIEHEHALGELPGVIWSALGAPRDRHPNLLPVVDLDETSAVDRARAYLDEAVTATEGQGGDALTYKVAAQIKDFGVSKETAFALMLDHWNERCSPPWEPEALREKVENAYAYGSNPPGSDHPAAVFGGVAVDRPDPGVPVGPGDGWFRHGDVWDQNVRWLYHQTLPAVGVAVIVGPPQAGKTFVNVELARSVSAGKPFFGCVPDRQVGVVFLFAGTEGSGLPLRLAAIAEASPLPISALAVSDLSTRGAIGKLMGLLKAESARMQARFGVPLGLVILETLSASGLLVDENSNSEIGVAFANLGTLSRELDALVMTTHHPPKNGEGARGGGAIIASADYVLEITRDGADKVRHLDLTKARDAEQRALGSFTLLEANLGEDDRGRPITSMTVSMGEPQKRTGKRTDHTEAFMRALEFALLESPEGAEWDDVCLLFRDLKTGSKERPNVASTFKRCVDYAKDAGAVESTMIDGVKYLKMKELTDG